MKTTVSRTTLLVLFGSILPLHADDAVGPIIDYTHDRVQTTLDPGMKRIGTIKPRGAREVGRSNLAIGCEMLDRDYGDFEQFKAYIEPLGVKRIRLQAGWAKTEKVKGVYDFAWLDRIVDYLNEREMDVLMETSYGNPIYPGGGGASLSDGMPHGDVGLAAWDAWINSLASHYKDRVRGLVHLERAQQWQRQQPRTNGGQQHSYGRDHQTPHPRRADRRPGDQFAQRSLRPNPT